MLEDRSAFTTDFTELVISRPAAATTGRLLVLLGQVDAGGYFFTSAPTGWTQLLTQSWSNGEFYIYYKIMGASEPSSYTWDADDWGTTGSFLTFSGVDTTTPIDVSASQNSFGTPIACPTVTTTGADRLAVAIGCNDNGVDQTGVSGTGWGSHVDSISGDTNYGVAQRSMASSGATGDADIALSTGRHWMGAQFAVIGASGGSSGGRIHRPNAFQRMALVR